MTDEATAPNHDERREFAKSRFKSALLGSVLSKGASALLQLLALPIAWRFLDSNQTALYGNVWSSVNWLATASLGYGPVATLMVAEAVARKDRDGEVKTFVANFFVTVWSLVVMGVGLTLFFLTRQPSSLFSGASAYSADVNWAMAAAVVSGLIILLLTTFEISRDGYQETGMVAKANSIGVIIALPVVPVVAWLTHSIAWLILAAILVPYLGRMFLAWRMITKERPYLWPRRSLIDSQTCWKVIRGNGAYSLVQLGSFVNAPLIVLLITHFVGLRAGSGATYIYPILFMQGVTLITQVTQPVVPSLREGMARGDHAWTRRTLLKFVGLAFASSCLIGLGLGILGPFIVQRAVPGYSLPPWLMWLVGAHFVFFALEFVLTNAVISVWRVLPPSLVVLGRSIVSTGLMFWLIPLYHEVGASFAMILGIALTSGWMLPWMLVGALQKHDSAGKDVSPGKAESTL